MGRQRYATVREYLEACQSSELRRLEELENRRRQVNDARPQFSAGMEASECITEYGQSYSPYRFCAYVNERGELFTNAAPLEAKDVRCFVEWLKQVYELES